jgi:4-amino-4-deoxy-L-arabinose transferase-like glycosyltransferase
MLKEKSFLNKFLFLIPFGFVLINYLFKERFLEFQNIAGDEPFSIYYAQLSPSEIIHFLSQGNNPPLFELILHYWIKFFGISEYAVRFLPMLFSVISVYFVYKIAADFFNLKTAIISASIFTFSNFEMYFAHEVRVYSLFMLLTLISFYAFFKLIEKSRSKLFLVTYIISTSLLLYSHYFAFFVLFVQFFSILFLLKFSLKKKAKYLVLLTIPFIFFLPFIQVVISNYLITSSNGSWVKFSPDLGQLHFIVFSFLNKNNTFFAVFCVLAYLGLQYYFSTIKLKRWLKILLVFASTIFLLFSLSVINGVPYYWEYTSKNYAIISYLLFLGIILFILFRSNKLSPYSKITLLWFFAPLVLIYLLSFKTPMFLDRYFIFISPAFYLIFGYALYKLDQIKRLNLTIVVIVLFFLSFDRNTDKLHRISDMTLKLKELKTDSTIVYLAPNYYDINFTYHYDRELFKSINLKTSNPLLYKIPLEKKLNQDNIYVINHFSGIDTNKIKSKSQIMYVDIAADFSFPQNNILPFLQEKYTLDTLYSFQEYYKLYLFKN